MAATTSLLPSGSSENNVGGQAFIQGAHNVNVYGGNFHVGNVEYKVTQNDILEVLKHVPNYRDVHSANLSRATEGTGPQCEEWAEYCEWLKAQGRIKAMWGTGMPGAGKTIFSAIVINEVEALTRSSSVPICVGYIYFRYSDHTKATSRDCLEVLVKQTIERHPECLEACASAYARHIREKSQPSERELMELLRQLAQMMVATFYFLDAMDEAPPDVQLDLIPLLMTLNVQLFITSRPMDTVRSIIPDAHCYCIRAQDRDLDLHINKEISRNAELNKVLSMGGPDLRERLANTVKTKCDGMFLHASLQLDALRDCKSVQSVEETLSNFPPQIRDVYKQTWQRIQAHRQNAEVARSALRWVLCAPRSLTVDELREFVAACPKTYKIEVGRLVDEHMLMALCRGLIALEDSEYARIVRFVHYTAKDIVKELMSESEASLHSLPTYVCLKLLEEHGLPDSLSTIKDEEDFKRALVGKPTLWYAYDLWSFHAKRALSVCAAEERVAGFIQSCRAFPVVNARQCELEHCGPTHMVTYFDLPLRLAGSHLSDPNVLSPSGCRDSPLTMAIVRRSYDAAKGLLALPSIDLNQTNGRRNTALQIAINMGDSNSVKILLAHPKTDVNVRSRQVWLPGSTPLQIVLASTDCDKDLLQAILAHPRTNVNTRDEQHQTPLMLACRRGGRFSKSDARGVPLLLEHPEIRINLVDGRGRSALMLACMEDYEDAIERLLAHPHIDVNLVDKEGKSALDHTSSDDIRRLLTAHPRFHQKTSSSLVSLYRYIDSWRLALY